MSTEIPVPPPAELMERLEVLGLGSERFRTRPPLAVRVNTLVGEPDAVRRELEQDGLAVETVPWFQAALVLPGATARDVQRTQAFERGALHIQGLASMTAPLALDPRPEERVLDLCAAPGSKTTQIFAHMGGRGRLVAVDRSRNRFYKLRAVLESQRALDVELQRKDGAAFARAHPDSFDRILVDAPCTSEGRLRLGDPDTFRDWKRSKVKRLAGEQRRLVFAAVDALRPGGVLVYSTCTFAPEENEGVVDAVLRRRDLEVEDVELALENRACGRLDWGEKSYDPRVEKCVRILPDPRMEGFFLARLRKPDAP